MEVSYNENFASTSESIPAVIKINGDSAEGGFRVVPADAQENPNYQVFSSLWKDAGQI